jgi:hypothetical protein
MTAVEWLANEFYKKLEVRGDGALFNDLVNQAKEIEKQQIITAYNKAVPFKFGKQYYNETYLSQQDKP